MSDKKDKRGEYAFVGCMFIGMGFGYYLGELLVGMFIGMGVGFLSRLLFPTEGDWFKWNSYTHSFYPPFLSAAQQSVSLPTSYEVKTGWNIFWTLQPFSFFLF